MPCGPTMRRPRSRCSRTMSLIDSLAMLPMPAISSPLALAALTRRLLIRPSWLIVWSRMRSWRIVGSVLHAGALGQLDQHLGGAPNVGAATGVDGLLGIADEVAGAGVEVPADRAGDRRARRAAAAAGAEAGALVGERRVGHRPAVVEAADQRVGRHAGVGHEHLVEQRPAGHLAQRADVDAVLVHVHREVGDALVLGHVGVRCGR